MSVALSCSDCPAPITRQSKSGRCRTCANRWIAQQPGFQQRRSAGIRRGLLEHPERLDAMRARLRAVAQLPHAVEARREKCRSSRIWELGHAALRKRPEAWVLGAQRRSETVMAWCPPELRDEYRRLTTIKKYRAAEAREIILAQHEKDMALFRRSIGG